MIQSLTANRQADKQFRQCARGSSSSPIPYFIYLAMPTIVM